MKTFGQYLLAQWKRVGRAFPGIMLTTLLLLFGIALIAGLMLKLDAESDSKQKVRIGVVGDLTDSYLSVGMFALQNLDSAQLVIEFVELSQEEAQEQLKAGGLSAYIRIPDGFIDSVMYGENLPIEYIATSGDRGPASMIMNEMANVISDLITESQSVIYAMQGFARDRDLRDGLSEKNEALNMSFFDYLFNRSDLFRLEVLGVSGKVSMIGYCILGLIIVFFFLWGINSASLFCKRDMALPRLLTSRGVGTVKQVTAEYISYLTLMFLCVMAVFVILGIISQLTDFRLPEWKKGGMESVMGLAFDLLPVIMMIAAFQLFLYEAVPVIVNNVLLQFLCAVGLGYLSGCIYPLYFFPEEIQKIAPFLPGGAALSYALSQLRGQIDVLPLCILSGYLFLFYILTVLVRKRRLEGSEA